MSDPHAAPPLRWLFAGAEQRSAAWRYWVKDTAVGLLAFGVYYTMRALPIDASWVLARWIGDFVRVFVFPKAAERMRRNWAWLRPGDNDPARVDEAVKFAFRNVAACYLEYAVLDRLWAAGRITVEGNQHAQTAYDAGHPIILVALHLGNWEVLGPAGVGLLRPMGYGLTAIHRLALNRFNHRLAIKIRESYGVNLITPDPVALITAWRVLTERKDALGIYLDEYYQSRVPVPAFGRKLRTEDNIVYAATLAGMTNAAVLPAYCERLDGVRFRVTVLPPVPLVKTGNRKADMMTNAERINAAVEPVVIKHLDQWLLALYLRRNT